ncbi:MAG: DUF4129 domain-containing protein [Candidatus Azobacteroides sp.]|nr:DUF4129 domain-containing protein [Candidatus Azobacteroides sp.]
MNEDYKVKSFHIILFILLCIPFAGNAQRDSLSISEHRDAGVSVVVRRPDQKSIDAFNHDDDFQYEEEKAASPGFFTRLIHWILQKILGKPYIDDSPFGFDWDYVIIPAAILIIIFAIVKLTGIKVTGIFGRKSKKVDLTYLVDDEDVRASEFDELLAKALGDKNYRLAVRYLYLGTLQQLDELKLIVWNPNKTNHSYIAELTDQSLKSSFREKVSLFELVWYGEYQIKESEFEQIRQTFAAFSRKYQQTAGA